MRLCIVTPSQEYLALAGVRIRYQRVAERLASRGFELTLEVIDQFRSVGQLRHDAYLFSKCHDARAMLLARLLRNQGKRVGVDLFDDYFSQSRDSRFVMLRDWLRSLAPTLDFFLCSTPRMLEVGRSLLGDVAGHVLNDPFEDASPARIAGAVEQHLERLRGGQLDVAWFGVGDNPSFAVGLHDLWAYAHELVRLQSSGLRVSLHILTNRRALGVEALERLRRLPVEWTLDEWTLDGEARLLAACPVAFVPVNAQSFSVAKSLNRAVTALTAGCQLLSPGFPLYARLEPLVYRRGDELAAELTEGRPRLRAETLPLLQQRMSDYGDPDVESGHLAAFLSRLEPGERRLGTNRKLYGVLHGARSLGAVHQLTQRLKQMSIGCPLSIPALNYDLRFEPDGQGGLVALLSEAAMERCADSWRRRARPAISPTGRPMQAVPLDLERSVPARALARAAATAPTRAGRMALYDTVMEATATLSAGCFPGIQLLRSEGEAPLHYPLDATQAVPSGQELMT